MARQFFAIPPRYRLAVSLIAVALGAFELFKLFHVQRMKAEIAQLENQLGKGQESWNEFPPLTATERRDLKKAQARLFRLLPKDEDIPLLLQEISRLARDHNLSDVSFNTGNGAAAPGAGQTAQVGGGRVGAPASPAPQAVVPQTEPSSPDTPPPGTSGPIDSFPVKMAFAGDYREIAYFLEELQKLPRLVTLQSLKAQRAVPQVAVELVLHAYYQKGELPPAVR
ncbi:MAG: type 4a pilus biogenesis protein PilO, partial [Candidatus Binatia bacterium]